MYLAIDIGGTKTFVASIDESGAITERFRFPTAQDYATFKRDLAANVARLSTKNFTAAAVGAPGKIDRQNGIGIVMGNLPWKFVTIKDDVKNIANCPVVIDNDGNLAGLSEALLLKDKYNQVLYITIGTGIGDAIIVNGQINLPDSEGGHMLLKHEGRLQKWESFASGSAIVKRYGKPASKITNQDDWNAIATNIAAGLINLLALVQPEAVVLGGGIGKHFKQFEQPLLSALGALETPMVPIPPITEAQRPEEAVLFGCFELAKMTYGPTTS